MEPAPHCYVAPLKAHFFLCPQRTSSMSGSRQVSHQATGHRTGMDMSAGSWSRVLWPKSPVSTMQGPQSPGAPKSRLLRSPEPDPVPVSYLASCFFWLWTEEAAVSCIWCGTTPWLSPKLDWVPRCLAKMGTCLEAGLWSEAQSRPLWAVPRGTLHIRRCCGWPQSLQPHLHFTCWFTAL